MSHFQEKTILKETQSRKFIDDISCDPKDTMIKLMAECFAMQQGVMNIPIFDGKNMPVSDFIEDIITGQSFVPATCEKRYVIAVLARLKGAARESTYGKTFSNLSDLIQHLEQRFAPHKTYLWYVREITTIQMLQNEGIYEFYDRLTLLKSRAQAVLENRYENANQMILTLNDCVLEAFIRGLPDWMSAKIEAQNPATLQEPLEYAINYEARH